MLGSSALRWRRRITPAANPIPTDTMRHSITILPTILLLAFAGCGEDGEDPLRHLLEDPDTPEESAETAAEVVFTDYTRLYGPGRIIEEEPYSTVTPNGAWINRSLAGSLFLIRRADPADDSELGYVEAYRLPDLPDRTAGALKAGGDLPKALTDDLRDLIEDRAEDPTFTGEDLTGLGDYTAATLSYSDLKRNSQGEPERAYNEVTLLLVGRETHVLAGYCFADAREIFIPELHRIMRELFVKPPPPPPPKEETDSIEAEE